MIYYFSINLSYQDVLLYYQGTADKIKVIDNQGKMLLIQVRYFRPYINMNGLYGDFKLVLNANGYFSSIIKLN